MGEHNPTGYSADVRLWLLVAGSLVPLSHASSTFVIAKVAIDLPPSDAHIVFTVDEERYERPVRLVHGMSRDNREAVVQAVDEVPF